jgi:hypothetical protein
MYHLSISGAKKRDTSQLPFTIGSFTIKVDSENEILISFPGVLVDRTRVEGRAHLFSIWFLFVDGCDIEDGERGEHFFGFRFI